MKIYQIFTNISQYKTNHEEKRCIQMFTCQDKSRIQKSLQEQLSYNFIHTLLQKVHWYKYIPLFTQTILYSFIFLPSQ